MSEVSHDRERGENLRRYDNTPVMSEKVDIYIYPKPFVKLRHKPIVQGVPVPLPREVEGWVHYLIFPDKIHELYTIECLCGTSSMVIIGVKVLPPDSVSLQIHRTGSILNHSLYLP